MNNVYENLIKYVLLFIVYLKFSMVEFPFDHNLKSYIKKVISGIVSSFLIIYENYIASPQILKFLCKHGDLNDKFYKASKMYNSTKGLRFQDVLVYSLKSVESISTQMKILSKYLICY